MYMKVASDINTFPETLRGTHMTRTFLTQLTKFQIIEASKIVGGKKAIIFFFFKFASLVCSKSVVTS